MHCVLSIFVIATSSQQHDNLYSHNSNLAVAFRNVEGLHNNTMKAKMRLHLHWSFHRAFSLASLSLLHATKGNGGRHGPILQKPWASHPILDKSDICDDPNTSSFIAEVTSCNPHNIQKTILRSWQPRLLKAAGRPFSTASPNIH